MSRIALDVDFGKIHWADTEGRTGVLGPSWDPPHSMDLILAEIASPVDYTGERAKYVGYRKWVIWNIWAITCLSCRFTSVPVLVAPSSVWTKGYGPETRWQIAGAKGRSKHCRDAQAMLFFYNLEPHRWVPLRTFMGGL